MHDPDYVVRKTEEDEKFKEQSFGACLATLGLIVAVAFFSVILISAAQHRQVKHFRPTQSPLTANNSNVDADGLLPGRVGTLLEELSQQLNNQAQLTQYCMLHIAIRYKFTCCRLQT
jgi:hypothetical protein